MLGSKPVEDGKLVTLLVHQGLLKEFIEFMIKKLYLSVSELKLRDKRAFQNYLSSAHRWFTFGQTQTHS